MYNLLQQVTRPKLVRGALNFPEARSNEWRSPEPF